MMKIWKQFMEHLKLDSILIDKIKIINKRLSQNSKNINIIYKNKTAPYL